VDWGGSHGFEGASWDVQVGFDRTVPIPNRAFLFSTDTAAINNVRVTGSLSHQVRHGYIVPSRMSAGMR
jgi:hypothetical protein